jgi:SdpC family antimicrobial peptide
MRRLFVTGMISTCLACGGAVGSGTARSDAASGTGSAALSGREMVEGFFFGEGRAASLFPELWNNPNHTVHRDPVLAKQILNDIESREPGLYERFASAARSGDRVAIDNSLRELSEFIAEAFQRKTSVSLFSAAQNATTSDLDTFAYINNYAVVDQISVIYLAVALASVVIYVNYHDYLKAGNSTELTGLERDQFVNLVAERFAAA